MNTKASEAAAEAIVDEATAKAKGYGDAYTEGATLSKTVEEYINAGVTWGDWHIGYEEAPDVVE